MSVNPTDLRPVDALEVHVLVDNALDILSTVPDSVTSELPNLVKAGATELSSSCLCCAAWGLSLVITTRVGDNRKSMLFDAGPEAYALHRNGTRLGFDFGSIECVVLSHGHFDHAGGLPKALELITNANGGRAVPMHVNPGMFYKRAAKRPDGSLFPLEDVPSPGDLAASGGGLVNADEARLVLDGTMYVSGEIRRVTDYEKGLPRQVRFEDEQGWVPDPLVLDERYVAVHVRNHGVVVFSACSHAGIVNVLTDAAARFDPLPLYGAMGGLHLSGAAQEEWIDPTVRDLASFRLQRLVGGHCTGWRALHALRNAFGETVIPSAVGQTHRFGDSG
jgi:7,8-dihydropterin-6-yl-methyl-4-(beta-D-ribofuranosyl)aminobenzene 5'-phosphate synthase